MTEPRVRFPTRTIVVDGDPRRAVVAQLAENVPLGVEVVFREPVKPRKPDQNALMWSGPLKDIASQVWINGHQYSVEVWHEHFKREFMPDEFDARNTDGLVLKPETYRKWECTPSGEVFCVASTTQLTVKGFAQYLEKVYAFGAQHGVRFGVREE